jgi:hypothetical protein
MSDEQRRVALFQAQPEGLGLFLRPAALSLAHVAGLHHAHSALLDAKTVPAGRIGLVLTGPSSLADGTVRVVTEYGLVYCVRPIDDSRILGPEEIPPINMTCN